MCARDQAYRTRHNKQKRNQQEWIAKRVDTKAHYHVYAASKKAIEQQIVSPSELVAAEIGRNEAEDNEQNSALRTSFTHEESAMGLAKAKAEAKAAKTASDEDSASGMSGCHV